MVVHPAHQFKISPVDDAGKEIVVLSCFWNFRLREINAFISAASKSDGQSE
jgi:hypothetical protein